MQTAPARRRNARERTLFGLANTANPQPTVHAEVALRLAKAEVNSPADPDAVGSTGGSPEVSGRRVRERVGVDARVDQGIVHDALQLVHAWHSPAAAAQAK